MASRLMLSFNPRPSFLTGESPTMVLGPSLSLAFQSTPVISDGRISILAVWRFMALCFNPRPSFLTGESRLPRLPSAAHTKFQSTPVISDGRITTQSPAGVGS